MRIVVALLLVALLGIALFWWRADQDSTTAQLDKTNPGYALYGRLRCHRCHGADLRGSKKGPPLLELDAHYDAQRLSVYLSNPDSLQDIDPRLGAMDREFAEHDMPTYPLLPEARAQLIDFLLAPTRAPAPQLP